MRREAPSANDLSQLRNMIGRSSGSPLPGEEFLRATTLMLLDAYDDAMKANAILENICEHMATEHIVFGIVGSDEKVHPDWCVQCVFDAIRERLEAHSRQWHGSHHEGNWSECELSCLFDRAAIERGRNRV